MVLVDSSVWIEYLRPRGQLEAKVGVEGLIEEYEALLCGPVKTEVLGNARAQDRSKLELFLGCLPYRSMKDAAWETARANAWKLRDAGRTVNWMDILIGTLALEWGCRVYTLDKHFGMLRDELGLVLYEPGIGGKYNPGSE